eukprot:3666997-Pyramimonas_sp.AAC.2
MLNSVASHLPPLRPCKSFHLTGRCRFPVQPQVPQGAQGARGAVKSRQVVKATWVVPLLWGMLVLACPLISGALASPDCTAHRSTSRASFGSSHSKIAAL